MTSDTVDPVVSAAHERARVRAQSYHDVMRQVASDAGGVLAGDRQAGVTHAVKDLGSLDRKVRQGSRNVTTTERALLEVNDLNRYTVVFEESGYVAGVARARELLAEQGFTWERGKNTWDDPFYPGYHCVVRDERRPHAGLDPERAGPEAPRHPVEVQFRTPESFAAKSENHGLYRLIRSGELEGPEVAAAQELQARRTERVRAPPGVEGLAERVPPRERPETADVERLRARIGLAPRGREAAGPDRSGSTSQATPEVRRRSRAARDRRRDREVADRDRDRGEER